MPTCNVAGGFPYGVCGHLPGAPVTLWSPAVPLLTRPSTPRPGTLVAAATSARLAAGRTGAGVVMLVRPRLLPQTVGVDSASAAKTSWVVQMLGAREVALGLGTLVSLRSCDARAARTWVAAGVLSDAVDVVAVGAAVATGRLSKAFGGVVVLTALGATLAGLRTLRSGETDI